MMFAEELVSCKPNLATVLDNTSPSVQDSSLLATCFGNRSAVLYELGRLEVTSSCKPSATHTMSIGPLAVYGFIYTFTSFTSTGICTGMSG